MNKRHLHHVWTKVRWIKPWYFLILAVVSTAICVLALRANNQQMIKLREAVYTADKNNTDTLKPLQELQAYVTTHMNTDLSSDNNVYPPIQLKYTYERLVRARGDATAAANQQIYNAAQAHCEAQNATDFSGRNRVPCIEQYVQSHGGQVAAPIPAELYKFAFVSPRWSPDLAGWSLVVTVLSWFGFVVSLLGRWWLKHSVK